MVIATSLSQASKRLQECLRVPVAHDVGFCILYSRNVVKENFEPILMTAWVGPIANISNPGFGESDVRPGRARKSSDCGLRPQIRPEVP